MILRRIATVGFAAIGVLSLAGCSEAVTGGTGLLVDNGRVHAVVQMCPDTTASEVHLTKATGSNYFWEPTTWRFDSAEFATVDLGTLDEFLDLVGDRQMEISSNSTGGGGGWVKFDAASIRALADGEILSFSWTENDSKVLDTVGFENEALMFCPGS